MTKRYEDNVITAETYQISTSFKLKIVVAALLLALFGLFMNFPMVGDLDKKLEAMIKSNPRCPITYSKLDLSYLFPKVNITKPVIPGVCFNNPSNKLKLDSVNTSFIMPSFLPPGLKFHTEIKGLNSEINLYPRVSAGATDIRITKSSINAKFINAFTAFPNLLNGLFNLEGFFKLNKNHLDSGVLKLNSENFSIPAQTINFFNIPELLLKKFNLVLKIEKNKVVVNQLLIGLEDSPIRAEINGTIMLNQRMINLSVLNLKGKIKFSADFMKSFSILEMMLAQAKPKDGFYSFTLSGTMAAPKPTFR